MTPLHRLLSRIKWDKDFGSGAFEMSYVDHLFEDMVRISFDHIVFEEGSKESFLVMGEDGVYKRIPFHRVRRVYKDGELIWDRS